MRDTEKEGARKIKYLKGTFAPCANKQEKEESKSLPCPLSLPLPCIGSYGDDARREGEKREGYEAEKMS